MLSKSISHIYNNKCKEKYRSGLFVAAARRPQAGLYAVMPTKVGNYEKPPAESTVTGGFYGFCEAHFMVMGSIFAPRFFMRRRTAYYLKSLSTPPRDKQTQTQGLGYSFII